jgi:hypothetical protein
MNNRDGNEKLTGVNQVTKSHNLYLVMRRDNAMGVGPDDLLRRRHQRIQFMSRTAGPALASGANKVL